MITQEQMQQFARFCEERFNLHTIATYGFQSLPICIIDCVYSLQSKYNSTINVDNRYSIACMRSDSTNPDDTITKFINYVSTHGGVSGCTVSIFNRQKNHGRLKSEVCMELAIRFQMKGIETIADFRAANENDMENLIRSVYGLSDAAVNYLYMLAGDPTRVKPDVHIHHCVRDCFGYDLSNQDIQDLFTDTVHELQSCYSTLTVRNLDSVIWNYYHR